MRLLSVGRVTCRALMIKSLALGLLLAGLAILAGCGPQDDTTDLAIQDAPLLAPANPRIGEPVRITAEVWNQGFNQSSGTTAVFQIDGVTRVTIPVPELQPGARTRLVTSLTFSTANYHTLTVIVDPDNTQDDADRGNNTFIAHSRVRNLL